MAIRATINAAIGAWQTAARELSIEVIAPFTFHGEHGEHQCVAWIPHFYPKGVLVAPLDSNNKALKKDAEVAGYACSFINAEVYRRFDRGLFIDTLKDWGFYGPEDQRPVWCRISR